jgi:transposase
MSESRGRRVAAELDCAQNGLRWVNSWATLSIQAKVAAHPEKRTPTEEEEVLRQIGSLHPHLHPVLELFDSFAALLRSPPNPAQAAEQLTAWLGHARDSGIPELKAFAAKLRQDQAAVVAALALPHSQGQTEGFITKLKLVKRSMYGRANFDLLRARVLYAGC